MGSYSKPDYIFIYFIYFFYWFAANVHSAQQAELDLTPPSTVPIRMVSKAYQEIFEKAMERLSMPLATEALEKTKTDTVQLHFFWTTGFKREWVKGLEADQSVQIGSSQWDPLFFPCVQAFLRSTPENKTIKCVVDQLTFDAKKLDIDYLKQHFSNRFHIVHWEDIRQNIEQMGCGICPEINLYLDQATAGNPAIASDLYRLVGMPLSTPGFTDDTTFTYCDVDTFLHHLTKVAPEIFGNFLEVITGRGKVINSTYRNETRNDVIKVIYRSIEKFSEEITSQTTGVFSYLGALGGKENLMSFSRLIENYVLPNRFQDYMKDSETTNIYQKPDVTGILGPQALKSHTHLATPSKDLKYAVIGTYAWAPTVRFFDIGCHDTNHTEETIVPPFCKDAFQDFITLLNKERDYLFLNIYEQDSMYHSHIEVALLTRRLGRDHPFNHQLHRWIKDNNPYKTQAYKAYLDTIAPTDEGKRVLREAFSRLKDILPESGYDNTSYFFRLWNLFDKIGIEFDTGLE